MSVFGSAQRLASWVGICPGHNESTGKRKIVEYIGYYNTERRHFSLSHLTPAKFELRWRAGSNLTPTSQRVAPRYPPSAGSGSSQATKPAVHG